MGGTDSNSLRIGGNGNIRIAILPIGKAGKMKPELKDAIQIIITCIITAGYVFLVLNGKAAVEGFAMLAMYVIKKFLDIVEAK